MIHSEHFSLHDSVMRSRKQTWSENSAALVPSSVYDYLDRRLLLLNTVADHCYIQIRIVKDTVSPKAGKKPHRGYAFIVYEREKDMKGIISRSCTTHSICVTSLSW